MWTPTHFPAAMRSLNPTTRAKAIELANQLLVQGRIDKQQAVHDSVAEARRWAREASHVSDKAFSTAQHSAL
ncbi:DUF2188 domain-containing protein [Spirosoma rhododendri]|uniref:DUF2188 domain-containing protein n=1 Tax=Spirosoma rhododendri TaxID=2728024 RepID=A0A7L5DTU2_9BACT|nr:hypothetical protein [Spirosoma rhododendri]QJD80881.1 hypothetical protein HH216_22490 [Spirosoma rhododendri]